ncbi:hypothetical protein A9Q89_07075 [Gammaproteobacteria bacterium 53_120_T64]|nr:hypothetical protein A9Q89_07075 [Gammaproteobacteria bacterium 53_120_T64]
MKGRKACRLQSGSAIYLMANKHKCLLLGVTLLLSSQVWGAQTNLGSYGQTQLQQDTGDAVQLTCGGFIAAGADPSTPLFATCRAMVHTANDLAGTGASGDSLALSEDQLAASLQEIATEEFAATESMANEISNSRMSPVMSRLLELRGGATGFSASGLLPGSAAQSLAANGWATSSGMRGGAAGDEGLGSALGGFINASYGTGDRDATGRADGFDFDSYDVMVGVDYRLGNDLVLGAALNYYEVDSDFDTSTTVSGGGVDADGWGASIYASWYKESFYFDAIAGFSQTDYDVERSILIPNNNAGGSAISETAKGRPESTDYTFSLGGGYNMNRGALDYGPYFRATYSNVDMDGYQESGAETSGLNLRVNGEEWESLTTVLGAQFSYAMSRDFGVLLPNARLGWVHQFENDAVEMTAVYVDDPRNNILRASTDDADEDYAELSLGLSAVFKGGMQGFFNYETLIGFDDLTSHLFTVGVRSEF